MIRTLILDDEDFNKCHEALLKIEKKLDDRFEFLNSRSIYHDEIEGLLIEHQASIDLVIVDLRFENEENGLDEIRSWADDNPSFNFGIIAVSNYTTEEAENVLGHHALGFGRNFLGLVPKSTGESFSNNLLRVIRSFTTPPFVRGGEKYFSTELIENQYSQFEQSVQIIENGGDLFQFSNIVCVQRFKESNKIKIYLNDGESYEGTPRVDDNSYNQITFFENFCYDFAHLEDKFNIAVSEDLTNQQSNEFKVWWTAYKDGDEFEKQKQKQLNEFTKKHRERIITEIETKLRGAAEQERRVFLCLGRGLAVNPLYLQNGTPVVQTEPHIRYRNLSRNIHEEVFTALGYGANHGINTPKTPPLDTEMMIKSYISLYHKKDLLYDTLQYLPLYGEKKEFSILENSLKDGKVTIRLRDAFSQRVFVFDELCSNKWRYLFQQLAKYYNCY